MAGETIGNWTDGLAGGAGDDPEHELSKPQRAAIAEYLLPGEFIVWAGRGIPRPVRTIPVFPSFFAAFLCACSSFALMVLFGIFGNRKLDLIGTLILIGIGPAALGGMAVVGFSSAWARHRLWQKRIARSFYVLTAYRAIVGLERWGQISLVPWLEGSFDGTRRIDHGDGTGSVYFLDRGDVVEPDWGFEGIRDADRVEALVREVLLAEKPEPHAALREL